MTTSVQQSMSGRVGNWLQEYCTPIMYFKYSLHSFTEEQDVYEEQSVYRVGTCAAAAIQQLSINIGKLVGNGTILIINSIFWSVRELLDRTNIAKKQSYILNDQQHEVRVTQNKKASTIQFRINQPRDITKIVQQEWLNVNKLPQRQIYQKSCITLTKPTGNIIYMIAIQDLKPLSIDDIDQANERCATKDLQNLWNHYLGWCCRSHSSDLQSGIA